MLRLVYDNTTDLVPAGRCRVWSAGVGEAGAGEALLLRVAGTLGTGTTRLQHYNITNIRRWRGVALQRDLFTF